MARLSIDRRGGYDENTTSLQDSLKRVLDPLLRLPILDGHLLEGVELPADTDEDVDHKLARPLVGWMVTRVYDLTAGTWPRLYDKQDDLTTDEKKLFLRLRSEVACTVDLWVF